jgi:hypothetical protein
LRVDRQADQLCGVRGISLVDADTVQPTGCAAGQPVKTAFEVTTGNPDVHIAVLDSGIEWNDPSVMANEADKIWLNTGELPAPRHDLSTPLAPLPGGRTCQSLANARGGDYNRLGNYWPNGHGGDIGGDYDILGDGTVSVLDWACDSRVASALYPAANFASARSLGDAPAPAAAGTIQRFALGAASRRYVAIRAVDEQGRAVAARLCS